MIALGELIQSLGIIILAIAVLQILKERRGK